MKVVCRESGNLKASSVLADERYVRLYEFGSSTTAAVGGRIYRDFEKWNLKTEPMCWDLLSIALSVTAADTFIVRRNSPDGWTRDIELTIEVGAVSFWTAHKQSLENMLSFLSGDRWRLEFEKGKLVRPIGAEFLDADLVSLFSGGLDSFAGAVQHSENGKKPLLVSQSYPIDHAKQILLSDRLGFGDSHVQLNHNVKGGAYPREASMRTRSFLFLSYGALIASAVKNYASKGVELFVPENGFISLNVPLTNLRVGSLSTRTTHPDFMRMYQELLTAAGLGVRISNPFQHLTKGQIVERFASNKSFKSCAHETNSCGRSHRIHMHCGRCVPCIIRRASFKAGDLKDKTSYKYQSLSGQRTYDDIMSFALALVQIRNNGIERWSLGSLPRGAATTERTAYLKMLETGIEEVNVFLKQQAAL